MKILRQSLVLVACLAIALTSTGCAVFMAAKQPPKKDLSVLSVGTPRSLLIAELGQPASSSTVNEKKKDVFSFRQGYSKVAKGGRAFLHGVADVATFGLWEVVGTPTEMVFDGTKMAFEVTYDDEDRIENVVNLSKQEQ